MERIEPDSAVAVRRCDSRDQAEQYALVLTAMGMASLVGPQGGSTVVWVAREDAQRAQTELTAYDSENLARRPKAKRPRPALPQVETVAVYWIVLLFFFAASRHGAFGIDWASSGAAQAGLMVKGEWWRAVTALCLHINAAHLLGNLVFGTVFLVLLAQVTGAGVAWLSVIVAGTVGNVISALVHAPGHTAIGASTAVFAALGVLAALRQFDETDRTGHALRKWMPVAGGLALLAILGFSGERTDVLAHVLGFASGIAVGWILSKRYEGWTADQRLQQNCAGAAGAIVAVAWAIASFG